MNLRAMRWLGVVLPLALAWVVSSCQPSGQRFQVKGTVEETFPERDKIRIAHERIPGYMEPMTMTFYVKDTNELAGLEVRDLVSFRMVVTDDDGWIENVKKIGQAPPRTNAAPALETTRIVREVEELEVGDRLPDYTFTNQFGQTIHTEAFRGQVLAFTFIFTRCPFPVYCPRMSTNFSQTMQQLKRRPDAPANWHLLTISFDPVYDTPAVLKAYAERYQYDPARWTWATGSLMEISALGDHFGLLFWQPNPAEEGNLSHNMRTVVLDPQGRVAAIFTDEKWKPEELVAAMIQAAETGATPKTQ